MLHHSFKTREIPTVSSGGGGVQVHGFKNTNPGPPSSFSTCDLPPHLKSPPPNPLLNILGRCRGPSGPCVLEGASSSLPAPWSLQALLWHLLCAIFPDSPHPKPSYTPSHNPLICSPCHTRYLHYFSLIYPSYYTVN